MEGPFKEAGSSSGKDVPVGRRSVVVPDRTAAFREQWGAALVGRTVDLETLVDLDRLLRIAKVVVSNIQYLGGLSILISFCDAASANHFLDSGGIWGPWFSKLAVWEGQSLPFERVAWLRFLGVPLHLVDPDVLTLVGKEFGKVLHVQKSFGEEKDLSVVRVGVLAGDVERIKEFVSIRWKDRSYRIWVEEELDIWVPDCLGDKGDVSPTDSSPMASSPVGHPKEQGSSRVFHVEDEEFCMGEGEDRVEDQVFSLSKNIGDGAVPNEVNINWQSFLEPSDGNVPNNSGNRRTGIHFFKAGRKSKKLKRGGPNGPAVSNSGSPYGLVDSTEKGRPKKRNRAQEVENSDPLTSSN
ncbi:hypothetical protein HanXRQr2_Chr15g0677431 [Helianthus annuus]|uniref:DUF4283 domain-containing protein n=1 Tax=Helianthus annuus TaxID=4232 RepID=A0A9K3DX71_HELAN|nr:hypothetical protein HanXRQr2_Chr15g0677431 [Helianthus annuus]KAJ0471883.1 hypothetical protein HanHA89_Chr15g0600941 [Helianthus annuus]KAJ0647486.1 hypothetical protein HanLR1_Chr15g0562381 [Helianthus annuus]KAJ0651364.1 hypothetical protein HanOQP8_Chr15g0560191 [Helianthus annuus]KAJ0829937.1 hypothetical protein HanPSC8_Chr15g0649481 [Helianthus annuus]